MTDWQSSPILLSVRALQYKLLCDFTFTEKVCGNILIYVCEGWTFFFLVLKATTLHSVDYISNTTVVVNICRTKKWREKEKLHWKNKKHTCKIKRRNMRISGLQELKTDSAVCSFMGNFSCEQVVLIKSLHVKHKKRGNALLSLCGTWWD